MKKQLKKHMNFLYILLLTGAFLAVFYFSTGYLYSSLGAKDAIFPICEAFYEVGGEYKGSIALPTKLENLPAGIEVTLYAQVNTDLRESLMVKSVFAPLKVYAKENLILESGRKGSYPSYMKDPPTIISIVPLPKSGSIIDLEFRYTMPYERSVLSLPAIYIGDSMTLLLHQFKQNGFSFLFSLFLIFSGLIMVVIYLSLLTKSSSGKPFLWLGLFALSTGIWVLGECDLSPFFIPYPSLLYAMSYLGLFTVATPFLNFGLIVLQPKIIRPIRFMLVIHYISLALVLILQFTGLMGFIKSLYWFHVITPLAFTVFAFCLLFEHFYYHNPAAKRFAPGVILLAISAIVELINYWYNLSSALTLFFQMGVLTFVLSLAIASGHYMRQTIFTAAEKRRLEYEMVAINRQLDLQRIQYKKLAESDALVKSQSHDLRHQLAVLRELNAHGDERKTAAYIDTLIRNIPRERDYKLCDNYAINAITSYYYSMAMEEKIDIETKLIIPKSLSTHIESDLCIIIGNLFENAIEACRRMKAPDKFIRLNSKHKDGLIIIAVDNSFENAVILKEGKFISSKSGEEGTGLSSVKAVAHRYDGEAEFETKDNVFYSSVYLRIE